MTWVPLQVSVFSNRKVNAAATMLTKGDVEKMVGHLARLWTFAIDHAEDGNLSHLGARAIAAAAGWRGRADPFVGALVEVGLLDRDLQIHNWETYAGRLLDRRRDDRERKKRFRRARQGSASSEPSAGTSAGRPAEVRAVQDKTVPNQTEQQTTSSMAAQADVVRAALQALRQIEWYPFSLDLDGALLTGAVTSTPQIDLLGEVRRWALRCTSEPPRRPRAALAGWLRKGRGLQQRRRATGRASRAIGRRAVGNRGLSREPHSGNMARAESRASEDAAHLRGATEHHGVGRGEVAGCHAIGPRGRVGRPESPSRASRAVTVLGVRGPLKKGVPNPSRRRPCPGVGGCARGRGTTRAPCGAASAIRARTHIPSSPMP